MRNGMFDRLALRVASTPTRRSVVGESLAVALGVLAAAGHGDGEIKASNNNNSKDKKKRKKRAPQGTACDPTPELCSSSDECCGGRVCAQNGCAEPDRPRCCAGVGQFCSGNSCECCGADLDCVNRTCVYAPK